jgi:hypothetical protein
MLGLAGAFGRFALAETAIASGVLYLTWLTLSDSFLKTGRVL